jgi:hypothetical protein
MRAVDGLLMALDDLIGGDLIGGTKSPRPPNTDVVTPRLHDYMCNPGLGQRVAVKPGQTVGAEGITKESVTGDSFVQYAHLLIARLSRQPPGELTITSLT